MYYFWSTVMVSEEKSKCSGRRFERCAGVQVTCERDRMEGSWARRVYVWLGGGWVLMFSPGSRGILIQSTVTKN